MPKPSNNTSWGGVAEWYDDYLEHRTSTYQQQVILPNLQRLLAAKKGETILDLACGSGFFTRALAESGAKLIGADISPELIKLAREKASPNTRYEVAPADSLKFLTDKSIDKAFTVLALQNIENAKGVVSEVKRVLKPGGEWHLVLNHPAFRNPGASGWEYDEEKKLQYRRIDTYLSERKVPIKMHPGSNPGAETISFHRPLQYYFKLLGNAGLAVIRLEEWVSHKRSEPGPRALAEDQARHEFPLFLYLGSALLE
jgi:ubiquinone/menaquinone biosynthesis C-methylase UbiE